MIISAEGHGCFIIVSFEPVWEQKGESRRLMFSKKCEQYLIVLAVS